MSRRLIAALAGALVLSPLAAAAPAMAYAAVPNDAGAEALLKKTIADITNGTPDYANMSDELATAIKANTTAPAQLKSLGAAKTFTRVGTTSNPWTWNVTFESGMVLTWTMTIAPDGKMVGLQVQPAG